MLIFLFILFCGLLGYFLINRSKKIRHVFMMKNLLLLTKLADECRHSVSY